MANEEKQGEVITVSDSTPFCEHVSPFYLKQKFSDITLKLDGQEIHAHKIILVARSKYFEKLIVNEQHELVIQDVSAKAFRKILKFFYTGSITLVSSETDLIFDVLKLAAKYYLNNLEVELSEKMSEMLNIDNVFDVLNKSTLFEMEELKNKCLSFMDEHSMEIIQSDQLNHLTQKSIVQLLERDSFLAPEIEIFKSVAKWCQFNNDDNNLVVGTVRLSCLTRHELLSMVRPSKLVENETLLNALDEVVDGIPENAKLRVVVVNDENLGTPEYKAEVISGTNTSSLLNNNGNVNNYAYHSIGDENGIVVKFTAPACVNNIHMRLLDNKMRSYSYSIAVSLDQKKWRTVVNYTHCHCRSYQELYFEKVVVKYIRILGTYSSESSNFELVSFEVYNKSHNLEIIDGIVCPTENVVTTNKGAVLVEGGSNEDFMFHIAYIRHKIGANNIVIQLAQPYVISSLTMDLLPTNTGYKYFVETSLDKSTWETAVDNRNTRCSGWQNLDFPKRSVVYIKITGTYCNDPYIRVFTCKCISVIHDTKK